MTGSELSIQKIKPTIFMKRVDGGLAHKLEVTLLNRGQYALPAVLEARCRAGSRHIPSIGFRRGSLLRRFISRRFISQRSAGKNRSNSIYAATPALQTSSIINYRPPRRWVVHVVQTSHHDVGYTDLPSTVLRQHDRWLDQALDYAGQADDYPEDAQFRIVIEQAWSLDHYLKQASPGRSAKMLELLRRGRFELAALFGNLTSELCGHETLVRALSHSLRLQRLHGIPLTSAEHNDIPGMSWGLARHPERRRHQDSSSPGCRSITTGGTWACSPSGTSERSSGTTVRALSGGRRLRARSCSCGATTAAAAVTSGQTCRAWLRSCKRGKMRLIPIR